MKGRKHTEDTKRNMSITRKGKKKKPFTVDHCAAISAAAKGRITSPETCAKLSAARKGKKTGPLTQEHKDAISAGKKKKTKPKY